MHFSVILRVTGILLTLFSITMALPMIVALIYGEESTIRTFGLAFAVTLGAGVLLALVRGTRELRSGDGFLITVLFYVSSFLYFTLLVARWFSRKLVASHIMERYKEHILQHAETHEEKAHLVRRLLHAEKEHHESKRGDR